MGDEYQTAMVTPAFVRWHSREGRVAAGNVIGHWRDTD